MKLLTRMAIWAYLMTWAASSIVYYLEGHPDLTLKYREEISAPTNIICAYHCKNRLCTCFSFRDGICRMYNTGEGTSYTSISPSTNFAFYKFAQITDPLPFSITSSTVFDTTTVYIEKNAIDGNLASMFHTARTDLTPWWCLELMEPILVQTIRLHPNIYKEAHYLRLRDIEIRVGMKTPNGFDGTMNPLFAYYAGPYDNSSCCSVDITRGSPLEGRYIHIRRISDPSDPTLVLMEVQIFT
ncbi:uncharacterized protein LOC122249395 [Penaeus japonicus]|uniref:uncharacterized protein LOC122249395 n=1 Tax=Penaeus japonicus TaxID=27405 RepID=UPI001C70EB4F|nr:uncharacterized protein LOC122249395 [Penaeus japonicus]